MFDAKVDLPGHARDGGTIARVVSYAAVDPRTTRIEVLSTGMRQSFVIAAPAPAIAAVDYAAVQMGGKHTGQGTDLTKRGCDFLSANWGVAQRNEGGQAAQQKFLGNVMINVQTHNR